MANELGAQNTDAWLDVLQLLMPQGLAWNKSNKSNQTKLLKALAKALESTDTECESIQMEMLATNANILLPEREKYLGLPECDSQGATITDRRNAVVTKDKMQGGLATWQIEELAADLGFTIQVEEIYPHHCLRSCVYPLVAERYRHTLKVKVLEMPDVRFTCLDNVLTPLINNDARVLECTLNRYKMGGKYYEYIYQGEA